MPARLLCSFLLLTFAALTASAQKPNIVLLFADDMGYGDLSVNGNPIVRTPNLDQLAREGIRLTSFYSAPSCVPARTQLMLGHYPQRVDLGGTGSGGKGGIPDGEQTLAQALHDAGYRTGMMGKWHLGYAQEKYLPINKGFDYWFGLPYSNDMIKPWVQTDVPLWLYENTKKIENPVDQTTLTKRYTEHAVELIRQDSEKPLFLYLAYAMPHLPIRAADEFRGRSRSGLFGDVIESVDWSVGQVLKALDDAGKADNTIVVFTSDNGPWLNLPARMLQAGNMPWHAGSPGPFRGAKHTTYEGGVRMPCIIRWPGKIEPGRVSPEMAGTLDIHATLRAIGGAAPAPLPLDGYDLTAFLTGEAAETPRQEWFYFHQRGFRAVRQGPWKLHLADETDQPELFHLELDPSERYDRSAERPHLVEKLLALMREKEAEVRAD